MERLLSRGFVNFVGPLMDHRVTVDFIKIGLETFLKFRLRCDTDVTHTDRPILEKNLPRD
jgi:hypothetical protein